MNDILLYIRNFAYSHECMQYSNNAAMQKALSPIYRRDRGTSKSLFFADRRAEREVMSETGVSSCDRYCEQWLTSGLSRQTQLNTVSSQ